MSIIPVSGNSHSPSIIIHVPQAALAQIWEAEKAARDGIELTKRRIKAVDVEIQSAQLGATRSFAEIQKQNDAFTENALGLALDFVKFKEQYDSLLKKKERLEAEKEQYGYQATLRILGKRSWNKLTDENKWKKGNLLTMIHVDFSWGDWIEKFWIDGLVPAELRDDRDIFLARLFHQTFHKSYYYTRATATNCPVFVVPEAVTTDKEVVAAMVFRYPEILKQNVISEQLLDDYVVFSAYIYSPRWQLYNCYWVAAGCDSTTLPRLLTKFSARIRGSSNLMLEAVKKTSFALFCLEGELHGKPAFALQLIERMEPGEPSWKLCDAMKLPNDALQHVPDSIRSEPGVVRAAVDKNGLCLQGATVELRGSEDIVRTACKQCAYAFLYCAPGPTKSKLLADKDFMLHVLSNVSLNSLSEYDMFGFTGEDKDLYKMLPSNLQLDRDIFQTAYNCGNILSLPPSLAADRTFLRENIEKDSSFWHKLPSRFEDDITFARAIKNFKKIGTVSAVFQQFPMLLQDREIWWTIIDSHDNDFPGLLADAVEKHAPASIRQDRELMLHAVTRNAYVFVHLPPHLKEEREFVELLAEHGATLMPEHVQILHPDLVVASLRRREGYEIEDLIDYVAPELLLDPDIRTDIQTTYIGEHPADCPDDWKNDEAFGLLAAELLDKAYFFEDLVSSNLRGTKSFMTKAVRLNPLHFLQAVGALLRDRDLALIAFSFEEKGRTIVEYFAYNFCNFDDGAIVVTVDPTQLPDLAFLRGLWNEAKEKIRTHESFFAGILCGLSPFAGDECALNTLLAKDEETTTALKNHFAALMGVPTGAELGMLRRVVKNLDSELAQEALWDE